MTGAVGGAEVTSEYSKSQKRVRVQGFNPLSDCEKAFPEHEREAICHVWEMQCSTVAKSGSLKR